jgi:hypothetical protein
MALKLLARAEYWQENMSLTQWGNSWSKKYKIDATFNPLINDVSQASYSKTNSNKDNLDKLANEIIAIIENRDKTYTNSNLPLLNL